VKPEITNVLKLSWTVVRGILELAIMSDIDPRIRRHRHRCCPRHHLRGNPQRGALPNPNGGHQAFLKQIGRNTRRRIHYSRVAWGAARQPQKIPGSTHPPGRRMVGYSSELAQLRPQIVPWSTIHRADWVHNDPIVTRAGDCYAVRPRPCAAKRSRYYWQEGAIAAQPADDHRTLQPGRRQPCVCRSIVARHTAEGLNAFFERMTFSDKRHNVRTDDLPIAFVAARRHLRGHVGSHAAGRRRLSPALGRYRRPLPFHSLGARTRF
jgi:hypothetical protein